MLKQQGYESAVSGSSDETSATIEMAGDMGGGETHEAQDEAQDPNNCTKASQGWISTVGGVQVWRPDVKKPQEDVSQLSNLSLANQDAQYCSFEDFVHKTIAKQSSTEKASQRDQEAKQRQKQSQRPRERQSQSQCPRQRQSQRPKPRQRQNQSQCPRHKQSQRPKASQRRQCGRFGNIAKEQAAVQSEDPGMKGRHHHCCRRSRIVIFGACILMSYAVLCLLCAFWHIARICFAKCWFARLFIFLCPCQSLRCCIL